MKKWIALMMALAMVLSLAACGSSSGGDSADDSAAGSLTGSAETADDTADGVVYKVGIVNYVDDSSLNQIINHLEAQLDARGEELGVTFNYADYYDNAQADSAVLNQIGADLVADEVDIIVAVATPAAQAMVAATEGTDIPVVFAASSDPVGAGLIDSLDEPGGNVTGTSDALDANALINLMLLQNPDLSKVGLLYDTAQDGSASSVVEAKEILDDLGIEYVEKTGSTTDEVLLAAQALVAEGVEAIFTPTDNTIMTAEQAIYEVFIEAGIPQYCGADSFALWGAFCGYGVNYGTLGEATADMVVDILVNGADPATTSVVTFDNGNVSVNTETCEALGYDLETIRSLFSEVATEFIELTTQQEFDD